MIRFLSLKYLQKIILVVFLFGVHPHYNQDYNYDYDEDTLGGQYSRFETVPQQSSRVRTLSVARKESDLMDDLLNPRISIKEADKRVPVVETGGVTPRSNGGCPNSKCFQCLDSCRHLKKSRIAGNSLIQYTYLRLCSMGCKEELACLDNNYCLPVMQENPDYFVQCSSKCNLFLIVPRIFKTGRNC